MVNGINRQMRGRLVFVMLLAVAFLGYIIFNLAKIQIVKFEEYQRQAIEQQTSQTPISAGRGTIYDRNLKALAENVTLERVFVAPYEITDPAVEQLITVELSRILDVEQSFIRDQLAMKTKKDRTIKNNVVKEKADEIRKFILDNEIQGIYLAATTKRSYPFGDLASHIIGFTGSDSEGRFGIEYQYDKYLKGIPGRIITAKNGVGEPMAFDFESYIDAKPGKNVVLTIDWSIQNFLEKNIEAAYAEADAKNRVAGIVMDINTFEILGMCVKPDFDLNDPYTLDTLSQSILDGMNLSGDAYTKARAELQYAMWKNKAVTEPYEPGSTFKIITAAMALEEKKVTVKDSFYCSGHYAVVGASQPIGCHKLTGHGQLTFAQGLQQSCNPVFMMTAERVGGPTFLKYFEAFGYNEKTGIDLPGEADSITHPATKFNSVELATSAFGQTFKVTPIQHIAGLAAALNGGKLGTPHLVKEITDSEGNVVESFPTQIRRTVVSADVSKTILNILADGVTSSGSAKNAYVKGYRVAAKTGTSQKRDDPDPNKRIGSCVGAAPADNPQVICIVIVDEPAAGSNYGGVNAAPYVSKILADVLPYLEITPQYTETEKKEMDLPVEDYVNTEVYRAKNSLTSKGYEAKVVGDGVFVTYQVPAAGSSLTKGGTVILYTDNIKPETTVEVPSVINMTATQVNRQVTNAGLNLTITGVATDNIAGAFSVTQSPAPGEKVPIGTVVTVEFRHLDSLD